jgi:cell division protein FtsW
LALVPLLGYEVKGATRWINLKFFSIQPSEILKGPILCLFSWFCYLFIKTGKSLYMFLFILIILFVSALLLLQPDIGTLMLYLSSFFLLIILYLRNIKLFFILGFFGVLLLVFAYFTFDHVSLRIDKFFSSENSPQVARSLSAIIGGGFFGVGLGEGQLKYSIPESHNDFIFAILIEEFGIFFGLFIALLYPIFFFLIKQILKSQPNLFIQNTTFSLCFILCIQAFINIGSSIDLIPPTGMTLPFISYGGSSMLSYAIIFGTLINFSKNEKNSLSNTS